MLMWVVLIAGSLFMIGGLAVVGIALFGVYRFPYVLQRVHAAAIIDTLGLLLILLATVILSVLSFASVQEIVISILKLLLILIFFWASSPVASHLICALEVSTSEKYKKYCEVKMDERS